MKPILPLIACLVGVSSAMHAADVDLAVRPLKPAFARGEPVVLVISLANRGDQDATVDLGRRHYANVIVHMRAPSAQGEGQVCTLKPQNGFEAEYKPVVVAAHSLWESHLTLDDFYQSDQPGTFSATFGLSGHPDLRALCDVIVIPSIADECERLWTIAGDRSHVVGERLDAGKLLSLVRDAAAAPYQRQIIQEFNFFGTDLLHNCVTSIVASKNPESIQWLISTMVDAKVGPLITYGPVVTQALAKAGVSSTPGL